MRTPAHFNGKSSTYFGLTVKPPLSVPGTPLWEPNLPPGARREGGGGGAGGHHCGSGRLFPP